MSKRLVCAVCWLVIVTLPLNAMTAESVGVLTSVGSVLVDNQPTTAGGAVFAGDVIETNVASKAILSGPGRTLSLGEKSRLLLGRQEFQLQSGVVVVSSSNTVLRVDNVTVTSASDQPVKFVARKLEGTIQILALEGTLTVNDGQQTAQVPATKGVSIGGGGGKHHWSWLLNDDIGILIVVAAAITAGVVLGIVNAKNAHPASPTVP